MDRLTASFLIATFEQVIALDEKTTSFFKLYDAKLNLLAKATDVSPEFLAEYQKIQSMTTDLLSRQESSLELLEARLETMKSDLARYVELRESLDEESDGGSRREADA